jgi:hypoxanthine phosphoribosyltransferase
VAHRGHRPANDHNGIRQAFDYLQDLRRGLGVAESANRTLVPERFRAGLGLRPSEQYGSADSVIAWLVEVLATRDQQTQMIGQLTWAIAGTSDKPLNLEDPDQFFAGQNWTTRAQRAARDRRWPSSSERGIREHSDRIILIVAESLVSSGRPAAAYSATTEISWSDFVSAAKDLATRALEELGGAPPDLIFAVSARGATLANLIQLHFRAHSDTVPPLLVAINDLHSAGHRPFPPPIIDDMIICETNRSRAAFPDFTKNPRIESILIVDDWTSSGDMLRQIRNALRSRYESAAPRNADNAALTPRILTMTMAASARASLFNGNGPDLYAYAVDGDVRLPWGVAW